mmetsp:Transcript_10370/g.15037  ORF Transcript_10370/g.15037 Transcript_10370/m.15037 type:complete len:94 (+) Transcript_10370:1364-1645(+)
MRPSGGVLTSEAASAVLGRDDEGPQATLRVISGTPCFISSSLHCLLPWLIKGKGFGESTIRISSLQSSNGGPVSSVVPKRSSGKNELLNTFCF